MKNCFNLPEVIMLKISALSNTEIGRLFRALLAGNSDGLTAGKPVFDEIVEHESKRAKLSKARSEAGKSGMQHRYSKEKSGICNNACYNACYNTCYNKPEEREKEGFPAPSPLSPPSSPTPLLPPYNPPILTPSEKEREKGERPSYTCPPQNCGAPVGCADSPISERQPSLLETRFDEFWRLYPKRVGKGYAKKCFMRIHPDAALFERMKTALNAQRASPQWRLNGGRFIPYPATWLNQTRWEDDLPNADSGRNSKWHGKLGEYI